MSKQDSIQTEGRIVQAHKGYRFTVRLENGHTVLAILGGRLAVHKVFVTVGDRVRVELSPYDLERGRIVNRM